MSLAPFSKIATVLTQKQLPKHEALLLSTVVKIIIINKVLGQSLVLAEIPKSFQTGWPHHSSPENRCSQLLNRQLKVALFLLQSMLLEQALVGLRQLMEIPDSWTTCLAVSICLSFVLEKIAMASKDFQRAAQEHRDAPPTVSDVERFFDSVYGDLFPRIYRRLSVAQPSRDIGGRSSPAAKHLLDELRQLHRELGKLIC
jgi:hypothetical protein